MKNYIILSTIFLQIFSLVAVVSGATLLFNGYSRNAIKVRDSKVIANELNEAKFIRSEDKKNAASVVDIAEMHLKEIYLAQQVQHRAKQIDVKELGKMIEKINSNTFHNLQSLAEKKSISIPTSTTIVGLKAAENLNKESGLYFDKEYCDMMVASQKNMIKAFEEIVEESSDAELKDWAFEALPALREHLHYALICQKKYGSI